MLPNSTKISTYTKYKFSINTSFYMKVAYYMKCLMNLFGSYVH
ncbi:MAG: hypothetical protein K0Q79_707 [Flavipsychrobacter sp.]|jgi:hypothetical protein|nr:hypothetical protein [Flavipsychrobacter sp.]